MKKVLFFDDEPFITGFLIRNLQENYGWTGERQITFMERVADLLAEINKDEETYDLFILDVMVPLPSDLERYFTREEMRKLNKDGLSTGLVIAEKIRKIEKYKDVPILFLTARYLPPIVDSKMINTEYLRKPVYAIDLSNRMIKMLGIE